MVLCAQFQFSLAVLGWLHGVVEVDVKSKHHWRSQSSDPVHHVAALASRLDSGLPDVGNGNGAADGETLKLPWRPFTNFEDKNM